MLMTLSPVIIICPLLIELKLCIDDSVVVPAIVGGVVASGIAGVLVVKFILKRKLAAKVTQIVPETVKVAP